MHKYFLIVMLNVLSLLFLTGASGLQELPAPSKEEIVAIEKAAQKDKNSNSPLIIAIRNHAQKKESINAVYYFIKNHPEQIEAVNNKFNFPLLMAAFYEDLESVKLLIEYGADVSRVRQCDILNTLGQASLFNNHKIMEYLLQYKDRMNADYLNSALDIALLWPGSKPNLKTVEMLKEAGADINFRSKRLGAPLLEYAIRANEGPFVEAARVLIEAGANIDLNMQTANYPIGHLIDLIILSVEEQDEEYANKGLQILQMMLNSKRLSQETINNALVYATEWRNVAVANLLLRAGAVIEHPNEIQQEFIRRVNVGIEKSKQAVPIMKDFFKEYTVQEADLPPETIMEKNPEKTATVKKNLPAGVTDIMGEYLVVPGYRVPEEEKKRDEAAKVGKKPAAKSGAEKTKDENQK